MKQERTDQLIDQLKLQPHPEGGYFREVYRSEEILSKESLPSRFSVNCSISTSIYYLLKDHDFSAFHRIKSDEIWHFYEGQTLIIYMINHRGSLEIKKLGARLDRGEAFQVIVPAGIWFAARLETQDGFALAGCTVAPGFNFSDFELASKDELLRQFPRHAVLLEELCRN